MKYTDNSSLISHGVESESCESSQKLKHLEFSGDSQIAKVRAELEQFELGRFIVANLGLNGFWTSYALLHPDTGRLSGVSSDGTPMTELEAWLLDRCPVFLATQERFRIFRRLTQPLLASNMQIASIPSGLMDDLLTLDYSAAKNITLTAVDLDPESLEHARLNHQRLGTPVALELEKRDAWNLCSSDRWDLVTSNGLNIYIESDERCVDFYKSIAQSLRPGGYFVMSFLTPSESWQPLDEKDLTRQAYIFREVLSVKWQCLRSEEVTRAQLAEAGFEVLQIEYDRQRMFPAIVARKI